VHVAPVDDIGKLDHVISYPHLGISLAPPSDDEVLELDAVAACDRYARTGSLWYGESGPTMFLALATADSPWTRNADGTETRPIDSTLVYVFSAENVPCGHSGGPAGAAPGTAPGSNKCLVIGLLDAATGLWLRQTQTNVMGG
jgi:hypothetical protein